MTIAKFPPPGRERVEKVLHAPTKQWRYVPVKVKNLHAIGRTCPKVYSIVTQEQVDQLMREYEMGWKADISNISIVQQLDLIATEILRVDRQRNVPLAHRYRRDYLSVSQWAERYKHEIPFPNIEVIEELRRDPNRRVHNYAERLVDRPVNKQGDHYAVFREKPKRVKK
ncbi:MAG: hypothetical protein R3330_14240 [Saprospiraceae bacterium]|nr:hypothetical protein [Saprospiraceae bacterium]